MKNKYFGMTKLNLPGAPMRKLLLGSFILISLTLPSYTETAALSYDYLINNKWEIICFSKDKTVGFGFHYGGDSHGTYQIKNDVIIITNLAGNHYKLPELGKEIKYKLVHDYTEIYPDKIVALDKIDRDFKVFINTTVRQKEGTVLKALSDLEFVVVNPIQTTVTKNVKVRDYPGLDSKIYVYEFMGPRIVNYLAQGRKITVQGRTTNKSKVGAFENYWYIVDVETGDYESLQLSPAKSKPATKYHWIYGEFIKFPK